MTNEEALSILHCPDTVGGLYSKKYGEALGMAMEALKREPCEDCISRQAAIEAINKYGSVWMEYTEVMSIDEIAERALKASKQSMIKILHDMPSVTPARPKSEWIPVSERLPEWGERVLTIDNDGDYEINHIMDDEYDEWFYDYDIIAWMPLPEPYKAESEVSE